MWGQAGASADGAAALAARQWGQCDVLPAAVGLELCSPFQTLPQRSGIGSKSYPSTGITLDAATASALLAVLVGSSTSATNASCALPVQRAMQQKSYIWLQKSLQHFLSKGSFPTTLFSVSMITSSTQNLRTCM